jgi:DNA-binding transcriptional ArsR family regulator
MKSAQTIPDRWRHIAQVFQALGDEQRQRLLLAFEPGEKLTPTDLAKSSLLSRPAVSHHLNALYHAGVLDRAKEKRQMWYWIRSSYLKEVFGGILEYVENDTREASV